MIPVVYSWHRCIPNLCWNAAPALVQWREKEAQHELAAAMLAVANTKHAVWRFASSKHAGGGGLTAEELAKLLRHQRLPVQRLRSTSRAPTSQIADVPRLASISPISHR
jgi:hypothetical protein